MTTIDRADRERQRFEHLVLGRPRPAPTAPAAKRRKGRKIDKARAAVPVRLAPGIEERVALREAWSHKAQGTPETHQAALQAVLRPGSLARLYASGAIDKDQLEAADQIREAYRAITAGVSVRTASWETRVQSGRHGSGDVPLGTIYAEFAYDRWRRLVMAVADPILSIIVDDVPLTIAAARAGMSTRRLRRLLLDALDLWWTSRGETKSAARIAATAVA